MSYVTKDILSVFDNHMLTKTNDQVPIYRLGREKTNICSVYIVAFANRLCITGDICLDHN